MRDELDLALYQSFPNFPEWASLHQLYSKTVCTYRGSLVIRRKCTHLAASLSFISGANRALSCCIVLPRKQGRPVSNIKDTSETKAYNDMLRKRGCLIATQFNNRTLWYGRTARYACTQSVANCRKGAASIFPPIIATISSLSLKSGSNPRFPPGLLSNMKPKSTKQAKIC